MRVECGPWQRTSPRLRKNELAIHESFQPLRYARSRRAICSRGLQSKTLLNGIETFNHDKFRYGTGMVFCFGRTQ